MGATIKNIYILTKDSTILNVWTNLRFLCDDMAEVDDNFPSYWTLSKKAVEAKKKGFMDVRAIGGQKYKIHIFKVQVGEERRKKKNDKETE